MVQNVSFTVESAGHLSVLGDCKIERQKKERQITKEPPG